MTYRMKKKPIKEGYKFFALCDAGTGFIYYILPDGLNEKKKRKIHQFVVKMVRQLPERKDRLYVAVMDNYFTLCETMKGTRKCGVAAFGTACSR